MPDLQRVVSDMLAKGASLDDVRSALAEMGVGDEKVEELLAQSKDAAHQSEEEASSAEQPAPAAKRASTQDEEISLLAQDSAPAAKRKAAKQADEEISLLGLGEQAEQAASEPQSAAADASATLSEISKKLDELLAAVKGIQELDKKLLEANRDLALKIKTTQ
jgi:pyruvate/2-oxoglutarate dehydrogenase complex dihydrolipoamide acyltransferase (E2) component